MRLHLSSINIHARIHITTQSQFSGHLRYGLRRLMDLFLFHEAAIRQEFFCVSFFFRSDLHKGAALEEQKD